MNPTANIIDVSEFHNRHIRPCVSEFTGTALFTLLVNLSGQPSPVSGITYPVMTGLSLVIVRGIMGQISGGHFNPAVTLSQFTIRRLDAISAISYMMVQIFGAFLGAIVFRGVVSNSLYEDYFVGSHLIKDNSEDRVTRFQAFLIDALLTAFICSVYAQANLDDECSRLTIPCTWAVITFISYPLMGQCANFAIALANSVVFHLFTGDGSHTIFVYLNGFAAVLGVLFTFLLWWSIREAGDTLDRSDTVNGKT